jgi:hypothetical protein
MKPNAFLIFIRQKLKIFGGFVAFTFILLNKNILENAKNINIQYVSKQSYPFFKTKQQQNHNKITTKSQQNLNKITKKSKQNLNSFVLL